MLQSYLYCARGRKGVAKVSNGAFGVAIPHEDLQHRLHNQLDDAAKKGAFPVKPYCPHASDAAISLRTLPGKRSCITSSRCLLLTAADMQDWVHCQGRAQLMVLYCMHACTAAGWLSGCPTSLTTTVGGRILAAAA